MDGSLEGKSLGALLPETLGDVEGVALGAIDGDTDGIADGAIDGEGDGAIDGNTDGDSEGRSRHVMPGAAFWQIIGPLVPPWFMLRQKQPLPPGISS